MLFEARALCLIATLFLIPAASVSGDLADRPKQGFVAGAVAGAIASDGTVGEVLGRALDPPVCCQLMRSCHDGARGTTSGHARSRCLAENGQPLGNQYCYADGMCRP